LRNVDGAWSKLSPGSGVHFERGSKAVPLAAAGQVR
jgi:hypothetical protein